MSVIHHLNDDLLVSYAAGALSEGWSIAVATHLALCPDCRRRAAVADAVGGAMLDDLDAAPSEDRSWQAVRARLTSGSEPEKSHPVASPQTLPQPLRDYVGGDLNGVRWQALGKGASQLRIKTADRATQVRLLRIPAGKPVPEHTHGGRELTLVLTGSFRDGDTIFARGDIEDADASLTHQPIATPEADCICLAVTDAPLRFSSWIVRLVQPILGI
ncbi:MAG: Transcriptional activator ChrR [Devosia sp.]|uniref:ChrR family anti-sigma-E factor n=1 Tax=Devosia sp. TaxID=1871048 RepID=UPI00260F3925|nr:ChrR family anti-sigma-E factor [Devosia sp.]MDB5587280.1 Transcriptional activator ChrR [Devosia sp.]